MFAGRPQLAQALLVVGGVSLGILAVAGAECFARFWSPDYLLRTRGLHVFSPTYGWTPRAGASAVVEGGAVTINPSGHRGREVPFARRFDRERVVVLGDSIAFGLGVSDDETFTHLLDVRDNGIAAVNLAVQGYGPDQELLVLLHEGLRYDPDVVALAFCAANDLADAMLPVSLYDGRAPKPRFRLAGDHLVLDEAGLRLTPAGTLVQWLDDRSHLFNRLSGLAAQRPAPASWHARYAEALHDEDYALKLGVALVREMSRVCRVRGIRFLVLVFPDTSSYREAPPLLSHFQDSLEAAGIEVIGMAELWRGRGLRLKNVALDGTGHLSPLGHRYACEALEARIAPRERIDQP